jgi:hypothetical protein
MLLDEDSDDNDGCNLRTAIVEDHLKKFAYTKWVHTNMVFRIWWFFYSLPCGSSLASGNNCIFSWSGVTFLNSTKELIHIINIEYKINLMAADERNYQSSAWGAEPQNTVGWNAHRSNEKGNFNLKF